MWIHPTRATAVVDRIPFLIVIAAIFIECIILASLGQEQHWNEGLVISLGKHGRGDNPARLYSGCVEQSYLNS